MKKIIAAAIIITAIGCSPQKSKIRNAGNEIQELNQYYYNRDSASKLPNANLTSKDSFYQKSTKTIELVEGHITQLLLTIDQPANDSLKLIAEGIKRKYATRQ
jgi:hypothetical protein